MGSFWKPPLPDEPVSWRFPPGEAPNYKNADWGREGIWGKGLTTVADQSYDAVIIGAGHNRLVTALYLVRTGR